MDKKKLEDLGWSVRQAFYEWARSTGNGAGLNGQHMEDMPLDLLAQAAIAAVHKAE